MPEVAGEARLSSRALESKVATRAALSLSAGASSTRDWRSLLFCGLISDRDDLFVRCGRSSASSKFHTCSSVSCRDREGGSPGAGALRLVPDQSSAITVRAFSAMILPSIFAPLSVKCTWSCCTDRSWWGSEASTST